nr:NmrA family NAD(P)-binding protein [Poseidonocella sp. HB161398]
MPRLRRNRPTGRRRCARAAGQGPDRARLRPHRLSDSARQLEAEGVTLAVGDLSDRTSIDCAMVGVNGVFSVQTSSPSGLVSDEEEVAQGIAVTDSAYAAGVAHIVYSSGGAAGKGPTGMGHFDRRCCATCS